MPGTSIGGVETHPTVSPQPLLQAIGVQKSFAGRPVLRLAIGRDLAPSLRDAGLYELLYSLSLTGALVALVALV